MSIQKFCEKSASVVKGIPCTVAVFLIFAYKTAISPLTPASCRFHPTCSEYGMVAFKRFGFKKGFVLTAKRLGKCRPGGSYGYDPVPECLPEHESCFH